MSKNEFIINFKSDREEQEFYDEKLMDARLRAIIFELARYTQQHFQKPIVITCVARTLEEQRDTYPQYFKDNGIIKPSAHCYTPCRAVDLRSSIYTLEEINELDLWFTRWFDLGAYYSFIYHDVVGFHIHVQLGQFQQL